jgi:hypothetical protein
MECHLFCVHKKLCFRHKHLAVYGRQLLLSEHQEFCALCGQPRVDCCHKIGRMAVHGGQSKDSENLRLNAPADIDIQQN